MTELRFNIHSSLLRAGILSLLLTASLPSVAMQVTGGFTGWWGQPDQQNQGLIIAVSRLPNGDKTGVIFWASYTDAGQPTWWFAQGDIEDERIEALVYRFEGITFLQPSTPGGDFGEEVGTMTVTFDDCRTGTVDFDTTVVGSGSFNIARLTNQPGTTCTGGLSDDARPDDLPQAFDIDLAPTELFPSASGDAEFELRPGRAEFSVEVEDLPDGSYPLRVGDEVRGSIEVVESEGEIEFRSPQIPGTELLDFDPRDRIIDVLDGSDVALTALAPAEGERPGNGPPFEPPGGGVEIEAELDNLGVYPEAEAEAELTMGGGRIEFEVEVEDVPVGDYALLVDGIERGTISVVDRAGGTEGELEFHDPAGTGERPLDFDPRGALIEIAGGGETLFSGTFPENPGGGSSVVVNIEIELANRGEIPDGEAHATFRSDRRGDEFVVEIEDVPVGAYPLWVGSVQRGIIDVSVETDGEDTRGEIYFRDPAAPGGLPLDFDPRGTLVEIRDGETTYFSGLIPN